MPGRGAIQTAMESWRKCALETMAHARKAGVMEKKDNIRFLVFSVLCVLHNTPHVVNGPYHHRLSGLGTIKIQRRAPPPVAAVHLGPVELCRPGLPGLGHPESAALARSLQCLCIGLLCPRLRAVSDVLPAPPILDNMHVCAHVVRHTHTHAYTRE